MLRRLIKAMSRGVGRRGLRFIAALAAAAGVIALVVAVRGQHSAPVPPASAYGRISAHPVLRTPGDTSAVPDPTPGTGPSQAPAPAASPLMLPASPPSSIVIPAIDVHSGVISLGKDSSGALAVPQPGPNENKVAWYRDSPTPGQAGPAVLEGHVDTVSGPSVFYRLGALRPGDTIDVTRADHSTAVFTVNAIRSYASHSDFPTAQIFGSNLASPTLRLITCSNFDSSIGHYVGNTVVFAHLTNVRGT